MSQADVLHQQACSASRQYMGAVAWPTIALGLLFFVSYCAAVALALTGYLSLFLAVPLVAVLTYLSYTILHDSAHGSISGNRRSMRWVNEGLGYMAAWILMIPLTAHRFEHMAHHRHTNDEAQDPDFHVGRMRNSLPAVVRATTQGIVSQFTYYAKYRWKKAPARQNLYLCLEVAAALVPRLAVCAAGFWVEGLALFVLAWLLGATMVLYLFAYIVHRPHAQTGRYVDTSTILLPTPLLNWLWMFQNYHSIHHLFPRVPFYKYGQLYTEIEAIMAAKGAPVYRLTTRGLKAMPLKVTA